MKTTTVNIDLPEYMIQASVEIYEEPSTRDYPGYRGVEGIELTICDASGKVVKLSDELVMLIEESLFRQIETKALEEEGE